MRIVDRIRLLLRARAAEPGDADAARTEYGRRVDELTELRRHIADAAAGRRRVEARVVELERSREERRRNAADAARGGHDEDAKAALAEDLGLERRLAPQLDLLEDLRAQERELSESAGKIEAQLEAYRAKLADLDRRNGGPTA